MSGTEPIVWLDGMLLAASEARVSVYDRAFRNGEGVFETLRFDAGHPFRLDAHLDRALAGAAEVGLVLDRLALRRSITEVVAANRDRLAAGSVRLTVSAGELDPEAPIPGQPAQGAAGRPTIVATVHPLRSDPAAIPPPVSAATVRMPRALPQVKAVSYLPVLVARRAARERGADEALLIDEHDRVLEAATANVAALHDRTLVTPPTDAGLLAGIARQVLLEVAPTAGWQVVERSLPLHELLAADEAVLTSSSRQVFPLVVVDGRSIGTGRPGPGAAELLAAYRAEVARERAAAATDAGDDA